MPTYLGEKTLKNNHDNNFYTNENENNPFDSFDSFDSIGKDAYNNNVGDFYNGNIPQEYDDDDDDFDDFDGDDEYLAGDASLGKRQIVRSFIFFMINNLIGFASSIYFKDDIAPYLIALTVLVLVYYVMLNYGVPFFLYAAITLAMLFFLSNLMHLSTFILTFISFPYSIVIYFLPLILNLLYVVFSGYHMRTLILSADVRCFLKTQIDSFFE